jgi:hypothetical protein
VKSYQERVINEKRDLDEKLERLKSFCFGDSNILFSELNPVDRDLLEDQFTIMRNYSRILGKRIERFT